MMQRAANRPTGNTEAAFSFVVNKIDTWWITQKEMLREYIKTAQTADNNS